jgi:hypothetical protein
MIFFTLGPNTLLKSSMKHFQTVNGSRNKSFSASRDVKNINYFITRNEKFVIIVFTLLLVNTVLISITIVFNIVKIQQINEINRELSLILQQFLK